MLTPERLELGRQCSELERLLREVLPRKMGGYPDLFCPKSGWEDWETRAEAALKRSGPLYTAIPEDAVKHQANPAAWLTEAITLERDHDRIMFHNGNFPSCKKCQTNLHVVAQPTGFYVEFVCGQCQSECV